MEGGEFKLERVLVAHRGDVARRLLRWYRERDVETVIAFSEPDAEASWLDEADYDAYLNGRTVQETYLHADRVVAAAMDAGCDALHPGNGFLAEDTELYVAANNANLAIIGGDPTVVAHAVDRTIQRARAEALDIPVIPATSILSPESDGVGEGSAVPLPVWVRARGGRKLGRVERLDDLVEAVARARVRSKERFGHEHLYLEHDVGDAHVLSTTVLGDRRQRVVSLGTSKAHAHGPDGVTWLEELGPGFDDEHLVAQARELVRTMRWVGPATVRWVRPGGTTTFLQSVTMRLTTAFDLTEQVLGVDLIAAHHDSLVGRDLGWPDEPVVPKRTGLQARLLHGDASGVATEGVLETLRLPACASLGVDEGAELGPHTEPLLAKITVVEDTREAAVEALRRALDEVEVAGVPTNLDGLREVAARL